MTHVLKSNVVVTNPNKEFKYYSEFGDSTKEVSLFVSNMKKAGYSMSASEFDALQSFVKTLSEGRVWGEILEVYPIMGSNINSALVKLKSTSSNYNMTAINGLSDSHLELVDGKVVGKSASIATTQGDQPMADTLFKASEIRDSVGIHAYIGGHAISDSSYQQPVFGGISGTDEYSPTLQLAVDSATAKNTYQAAYWNAPYPVGGDLVSAMSVVSMLAKPQVLGQSSVFSIFVDGVSKGVSIPTSTSTYANDISFGLFGRTAKFSASQVGMSTAYTGNTRFVCVTTGYLSDSEVSLLNAEIKKLMIALGKS